MMNGKKRRVLRFQAKAGEQGSGAGAVSQKGLDGLHGLALLFFKRR